MLKRSLATAVAALLFSTVICARPVSAESKQRQIQFAEKVKVNIAKLGTGSEAQVAVKLRNKTKVAGYISEVSDKSFVVVHPKFGMVTTVDYADVVQARGNNLSNGAKIAIGIGIGAAAVLIVLLIYLNCCTG